MKLLTKFDINGYIFVCLVALSSVVHFQFFYTLLLKIAVLFSLKESTASLTNRKLEFKVIYPGEGWYK